LSCRTCLPCHSFSDDRIRHPGRGHSVIRYPSSVAKNILARTVWTPAQGRGDMLLMEESVKIRGIGGFIFLRHGTSFV
jgi:hypothetical protein